MKAEIKVGMRMKYPGKKGLHEIVEVKFNPVGAPNSNTFYCRCKASADYWFRQDYALELITGVKQLKLEFQ
jgi:hypothetical protein